ncbi:hypothetical protein J1614_008017 [Plenodomus biglobosus]|nr:hypothetical protein J1614_008017 [Plenodomus biglobosus]
MLQERRDSLKPSKKGRRHQAWNLSSFAQISPLVDFNEGQDDVEMDITLAEHEDSTRASWQDVPDGDLTMIADSDKANAADAAAERRQKGFLRV